MATTQQIQAPPPTSQQIAVSGAVQALNTITQQLNSAPITALSTSAAAALPLTPWGALPVQGASPLAVVNPNALQAPIIYAAPFYKNVWLMAGLGLGLAAVGVALIKFRPHR